MVVAGDKFDTVIIGSGPAGFTAAIYLARAGFTPLVITGDQPGGQITLTTEMENYPGFEKISGRDLMQRVQKQAEKFGAKVIIDRVVEIKNRDSSGENGYFSVRTRGGENYLGKSILLAVGASSKWLDIPGLDRFRCRGVSVCAACDGPFFREKVVAVVGGGDTAFTEADFLSRFVKKIYLIHRRESFRSEKILQDRVLTSEKVTPIYNSEPMEFLGEGKLRGVKLTSKFKVESDKYVNDIREYPLKYGDNEFVEIDDKSGISWELPVDGVFVAIGFNPNTEFLKGFVDLDEKGYIKLKDGAATSKEGVFAAGDCANFKYRQAIAAAGMGCQAAIEIGEWLKGEENA